MTNHHLPKLSGEAGSYQRYRAGLRYTNRANRQRAKRLLHTLPEEDLGLFVHPNVRSDDQVRRDDPYSGKRLGVLGSWLKGQSGKSWNAIYSEFSTRYDCRNYRNYQARQYLSWWPNELDTYGALGWEVTADRHTLDQDGIYRFNGNFTRYRYGYSWADVRATDLALDKFLAGRQIIDHGNSTKLYWAEPKGRRRKRWGELYWRESFAQGRLLTETEASFFRGLSNHQQKNCLHVAFLGGTDGGKGRSLLSVQLRR